MDHGSFHKLWGFNFNSLLNWSIDDGKHTQDDHVNNDDHDSDNDHDHNHVDDDDKNNDNEDDDDDDHNQYINDHNTDNCNLDRDNHENNQHDFYDQDQDDLKCDNSQCVLCCLFHEIYFLVSFHALLCTVKLVL